MSLTSLNLFNTNSYNTSLIDFSFVKELQSLTELDLSANKLIDVSFLKELKGLTSLYLLDNFISDFSFLGNLKGLSTLDIGMNRLTDVSFLKRLKGLTSLDLVANDLTDISFLKDLKGLTSLNLGGNELSDFYYLEELKNLTSLKLGGNALSDVTFLKELKCLTSLDLSGNQILGGNGILDGTILPKLESLQELDLSRNDLSDVSFLRELRSLTSLDLQGNKLSDVSFLKELKGLTGLFLRSNKFSDISFLKDLRKLTDFDVIDNPITNPPAAVVEQGLEAIWKYLDDEKEQGIEHIYEAKVLIVGETETGKTTLFNKLLDKTYLPQKGSKSKKKSTVGVNIKTWEFQYNLDKDKLIKANLWDFGGQEIQYTLHQYFLTNKSFYVFLISNRSGDNQNIHRADYWFNVISLLGKDCPVLVVLNERNDSSANSFNIEKYKHKFGKELGAIEKLDVDFSKNDYRWDALRAAIEDKISNLPHIGKETKQEIADGIKRGLPKKWVEVRRRIEQLDKNYIELGVYHDICRDAGLYEKPEDGLDDEILSQSVLLKTLHNLGVIINYEDSFLRNYLILNPKWLTESLYMVLEDKEIKDKNFGKFTSQQIEKKWKVKAYSNTEYEILLNLMLKDNFEIAYKVSGKTDEYVIPMLLPDQRLDYRYEETKTITLIVRFSFLPSGLFSRLIVQLNNYINVQDGKQIVWKKGMLLGSDAGSYAEVIESDDREQTPKEVLIRISGDDSIENKRFLNQIVSQIHQINKDWYRGNLSFDELIPCNCDVCSSEVRTEDKQLFKLKTLQGLIQQNEETINSEKSLETGTLQKVQIRELLDGVYLERLYFKDQGGDIFYNTFNESASVAQGDSATAYQMGRKPKRR